MKRFFALLFLTSALIPAQAYATRTVTSPYVEKSVLKLKSKTGITHDDERKSRDGAVAQKFGAEYGITDRLSLEAETDIENAGDNDNTDVTAFSVKGKVQFTEKDQHWINSGARLTYEANLTNGGADAVELKFILAKDTEKFRHIGNIILDHEVGDESEGGTNAGFSWGSRYKWFKAFEPGFEMYNNVGRASDRPHYADQDHSIGPVAYGKLGENIKYEAGYLVGFSENSADGRFKAVLEYGFKF